MVRVFLLLKHAEKARFLQVRSIASNNLTFSPVDGVDQLASNVEYSEDKQIDSKITPSSSVSQSFIIQ